MVNGPGSKRSGVVLTHEDMIGLAPGMAGVVPRVLSVVCGLPPGMAADRCPLGVWAQSGSIGNVQCALRGSVPTTGHLVP